MSEEISEALEHILERRASSFTYRREPRCRVCGPPLRNLPNAELVEDIVNTFLAKFRTVPDIINTITPLMEEWEESERPTADSIYNHKKRHFNITMAAARDIMERRAIEQQGQNFEEGKSTIITAHGLLELVVQNGAQAIAEGLVIPDVKETITAAIKLDEFEHKGGINSAELIQELDALIKAVSKVVTPEQMERIKHEIVGSKQGELEEGYESDEVELGELEA